MEVKGVELGQGGAVLSSRLFSCSSAYFNATYSPGVPERIYRRCGGEARRIIMLSSIIARWLPSAEKWLGKYRGKFSRRARSSLYMLVRIMDTSCFKFRLSNKHVYLPTKYPALNLPLILQIST